MSIRQLLDTYYLCWFSQPKAERTLYRWLKKHPVRCVLELGIATESRTRNLIRIARHGVKGGEVRYVGIDMFDARPEGQPRLTLKHMHQALHASGATIRLVPGDAVSGLARSANQLQAIDLMVISGRQEAERLAKMWLYVPRILAPHAAIFVEHCSNTGEVQRFTPISGQEFESLVRQSERARRAA